MSSRHSSTPTGTQKGSPSVTLHKGSVLTRAQEPLDDQLTDWWSSTVLGGDNPFVSDDSQASLGWEFTMEDLPMTTATNAVDSHSKRGSKSTEQVIFFFDDASSQHKKKQVGSTQASENR